MWRYTFTPLYVSWLDTHNFTLLYNKSIRFYVFLIVVCKIMSESCDVKLKRLLGKISVTIDRNKIGIFGRGMRTQLLVTATVVPVPCSGCQQF